MHLKLTNGTPAKYTLGQLRRDNPQTSFPKSVPDDLLASYDVYPYTRPIAPEYDGLTHRLTDGVFEQVDGAWSLPYVVELQTRKSAEALGLYDRGVVAPGYCADLNVIDFDRLRLLPPEVSYDLPLGGRRLVQTAEGYEVTIVAGIVTRRDGAATGALPGRMVLGAQLPPQAIAAE